MRIVPTKVYSAPIIEIWPNPQHPARAPNARGRFAIILDFPEDVRARDELTWLLNRVSPPSLEVGDRRLVVLCSIAEEKLQVQLRDQLTPEELAELGLSEGGMATVTRAPLESQSD